jgi:hypothetical protein
VGLIPQQFLEFLTSGSLTGIPDGLVERPAHKVKILAEISHVFFRHGFRPPITALMGDTGIIAQTV